MASNPRCEALRLVEVEHVRAAVRASISLKLIPYLGRSFLAAPRPTPAPINQFRSRRRIRQSGTAAGTATRKGCELQRPVSFSSFNKFARHVQPGQSSGQCELSRRQYDGGRSKRSRGTAAGRPATADAPIARTGASERQHLVVRISKPWADISSTSNSVVECIVFRFPGAVRLCQRATITRQSDKYSRCFTQQDSVQCFPCIPSI